MGLDDSQCTPRGTVDGESYSPYSNIQRDRERERERAINSEDMGILDKQTFTYQSTKAGALGIVADKKTNLTL